MRFWTIINLRNTLTLRERAERLGDWALLMIAHHMPNRLKMWTLASAGNRYAARTGEVVPDMKFMDVFSSVTGFDKK
jgi:hypothetical protein